MDLFIRKPPFILNYFSFYLYVIKYIFYICRLNAKYKYEFNIFVIRKKTKNIKKRKT
jgi:hypothetical protein